MRCKHVHSGLVILIGIGFGSPGLSQVGPSTPPPGFTIQLAPNPIAEASEKKKAKASADDQNDDGNASKRPRRPTSTAVEAVRIPKRDLRKGRSGTKQSFERVEISPVRSQGRATAAGAKKRARTPARKNRGSKKKRRGGR